MELGCRPVLRAWPFQAERMGRFAVPHFGPVNGILAGLFLVLGQLSAFSAESPKPAFQRVLAAPARMAAGDATLPAGAKLFVRLETPVSTTSSHLRAPITARVVREVLSPQGVAIPLGVRVRGRVEKLIPSSNPTDRALLRLAFTQLEIPGQAPIAFAAHVAEVENARETVLPNGTIRGVLASELPLSLIDDALGKLGKSTGVQASGDKAFGKPNTAIEYAAGTDLQLSLDQPLSVNRVSPPAASQSLEPSVRAALDRMLADAPQRASGKDGKPGDPLNLVLIGSEAEIGRTFEQAGWSVPERSSGKSIGDTVRAAIGDVGYGKAPISDLYLYGRREDLAFEKMLNTFAKRHHLRIWRTPVRTPDGRHIWLVAATHDTGIDIHPGVVSHAIDPDLDDERAKVGADLLAGGTVSAEQLVTRANPLSEGLTATGGAWKTDGQLLAIEFKPQ